MKSKAASRSTCRARSERKMAAPFSTPTKIIDCPAKSFVICAPNSTTRLAISSRLISTFRSAMAIHIKLAEGLDKAGTQHTADARGPAGLAANRLSTDYRRSRSARFMNLKGTKLTWLGHATFRIETPGGKTVIIDPWIMGNPMCPPAEKNVKKVDVLLCTHGHGDHIGDAVEIIQQHNPVLVGIPELTWG